MIHVWHARYPDYQERMEVMALFIRDWDELFVWASMPASNWELVEG